MSKDTIHGRKTISGETSLPPFGTSTFSLEEYSIQKEIGRGGMAIVYEAIEKSLNRVVALKVLGKELGRDNSLIKRFVYEAQSAARLSHPNIVQIYSIGEEQGVYYFAMEYVRGSSVEDLLVAGRRFSVSEAANIIRQTTLGLRDAYKAGVVHRDIKPGNILVANNGLVKVADFGLAAEVKLAQVAPGGRIVGTPLYMSPEQAQGKEGDHRSDMYSLGITFYQMLVGQAPFTSMDTKELINAQISKPLPLLPAKLPPFVSRIVYRLTNKDPGKRYPDYDALLDDLDTGLKNYLTRRRRRIILGLGLVMVIPLYVYDLYRPLVRTVPPIKKMDQNQVAEQAYQHVAEFVKDNPEASDRIVKRYIWIINRYPGTKAAVGAEQKLEIIGFAKDSKGKNDLEELNAQYKDLIAQGQYQEAIDKYTQLKYKYRDSEIETLAQGYIGVIRETAFRDFSEREKEAVRYLGNREFDKARETYQRLISEFQMPELVNRAKRRLVDIDNMEQKLLQDEETKQLYLEIKNKIEALVEQKDYQQARMVLEEFKRKTDNSHLKLMLDDQLAYVAALYGEFKNEAVAERQQEGDLEKLIEKLKMLLPSYRFMEAREILTDNKIRITQPELREQLDYLIGKVNYLLQVKELIIDGINKKLVSRKVDKEIRANEDKVVIFVRGGFIGVSWAENPPIIIYELAKEYLEPSDPSQHLALGVFCLTYGLESEAQQEMTEVIRLDPERKDEVEKINYEL